MTKEEFLITFKVGDKITCDAFGPLYFSKIEALGPNIFIDHEDKCYRYVEHDWLFWELPSFYYTKQLSKKKVKLWLWRCYYEDGSIDICNFFYDEKGANHTLTRYKKIEKIEVPGLSPIEVEE